MRRDPLHRVLRREQLLRLRRIVEGERHLGQADQLGLDGVPG
jgi:hypothetical protein